MTAAQEQRKTELAEAYAGKYVNETAAEPTDEEIARVLSACVSPPRENLYPAIRESVYQWRSENGRASRLWDA